MKLRLWRYGQSGNTLSAIPYQSGAHERVSSVMDRVAINMKPDEGACVSEESSTQTFRVIGNTQTSPKLSDFEVVLSRLNACSKTLRPYTENSRIYAQKSISFHSWRPTLCLLKPL